MTVSYHGAQEEDVFADGFNDTTMMMMVMMMMMLVSKSKILMREGRRL